MSLLDKIEDITGAAGSVLSGDVRATLETNIAPAIEVYGGPGEGGSSIASLLGIRAGIVVRDSSGRKLAQFGDPATFEPLRALIMVVGVFAVVLLIRRMVR